jgi:hypothetical protein
VKLGASFGAAIPTGSAFTFATGWPTTNANLLLYNGESQGGPSYLVERAWCASITAGATGSFALVGQIAPPNSSGIITGVTGTVIDNTAVLRWQLSNRVTSFPSNARLATPAFNAGATNRWFGLGSSVAAAGVQQTPTAQVEANLYGRIILPPGSYMAFAGLCSAASGTGIIGVEWHEVMLNLG